jgi:hypothetical protein
MKAFLSILSASLVSLSLLKLGWIRISCVMFLSALIRHTVQPFTESDDTKCCDNTTCPPEDGHVNARNMSRIVM